MDNGILQVVPWHDRSVGGGDARRGMTQVLAGETTDHNDHRNRDDVVGDDELPGLYLDQYESLWDAILARL